MPQFNLSETSGEELRRLFYESRHRGDMAFHDAVLRELRAREARPPEPRNFQPQPDRREGDDRAPGAAPRPPSEGFAPVEPYLRADRDPNLGAPRRDPPSPFGPHHADRWAGAAPAPEPDRLTTLSVAPSAAPPRSATATPRSQAPAKFALFGALALAVGGLGGWLAHEGAGRHAATGPGGAAVTARPGAASARSPDRPDDTGTQPTAASPAEPARRGIVIIQAPPRVVRPASTAAIGPRVRQLAAPAPRPLLPAQTQPALAAPQQGGPVRVFIHTADPAQTPAVDRISSDLRGLSFAGQPVGVPPVRFVQSAPRRTEVRCLKHADCAAAGRIAHALAQDLRTPVAVVDMSRTYEHDASVRQGSLELWLRPG